VRLWPRKQVYVDDLPKTHDLRFAVLFLLLFGCLLGAVYAVGFFVAGDRLARGSTVVGVDIGGMREPEAGAKLKDELVPRLSKPVKVTALGKSFTIDGQQAGISFDIEATVRSGLGSSQWDPEHMLDVVLGGEAIDPVVEVDHARLDRVLGRIAAAVAVKPVDSRVTFPGGQPMVTVGHDGSQLDAAAAAEVLQDAILAGEGKVALPVVSVRSAISADEARRFAAGVAARAVSGPVRIRIADVTRTLGVAVFAPALRTSAVGGHLTLAVDAAALRHRSSHVLASLPHHPSNARIAFRNGRPVVVPSTSGVSVQPADWAAAVLSAAGRQGGSRVASAKVTPDVPRFATGDARRLKIDQRLATVTLPVRPGVDMDALRRAATRLNGSLLRPSDDFSFLANVGASDPVASTLLASAAYSAAFHAGMENIFRTPPHASVIGAEPGLDASIAPGVELAWVNHTPYGVYVRAVVSGGKRPDVTVAIWGHRFWTVSVDSTSRYNVVPAHTQRLSGRSCQPRRGIAGFDIDVSRTMKRPGEKARTEHTHSHYDPVDKIVCRGR
jgi:vancomycin resistance protein YoaR